MPERGAACGAGFQQVIKEIRPGMTELQMVASPSVIYERCGI